MTIPYAATLRPLEATDAGAPTALLLSRDAALVEALERLAASVGTRLDVRGERPSREAWAAAPLVLVGPDLADDLRDRLPRRSGVVVVAHEADGAVAPSTDEDSVSRHEDAVSRHQAIRNQALLNQTIWNQALSVGAERVALLPHGQEWLVEALADSLSGSRRAPMVAVVGGCGGAGASVLSVAVAVAAAVRGQRVLLADLDPWGGGIDLLVGADDVPGLRWPELSRVRGRVSGGMLREALPRVDGLSLLSWDRQQSGAVPPEAAASVAAGAVRGFDLVVADLPRGGSALASAWLRLVDLVLVVLPADDRAVAAASRVVADLDRSVPDLRAVVRGPTTRSMPAEAVADLLGLPLFAELRPETGLHAALARREAPGLRPRGPLARCAARVLEAVEQLEHPDRVA